MSKELPNWAQEFKELHAKYDEHKALDAMFKVSLDALSIAWEALEVSANQEAPKTEKEKAAYGAMRRIEELGNEKLD